MSFFDWILGRDLSKGERSPIFDYINTGSIETTQPGQFTIETNVGSWKVRGGTPRAYYPFKNITIQNNSNYQVRLLPNGSHTNEVVVMNRGMRTLRDVAIFGWVVELVGTTAIGANKIMITVWNE